MTSLIRAILLLFVNFACGNIVAAQERVDPAQEVADYRNSLLSDDAACLKAMNELMANQDAIRSLIPELIDLVRTGRDPVMLHAVQCLATIGKDAAPAVSAVVDRLDNADYQVRASLCRMLCAVGPSAMDEVNKGLHSTSAHIRSSVLHVISQISTVDAADLERLQADPDIRVRVAVAQGWKKHGALGVERRIALLMDAEPAVASLTAQTFCFDFADTSKAVSPLIDCLARKDVARSAAEALLTFGVDARAAIPAVIKTYPLGNEFAYSREDLVDTCLKHIGPPRMEDLDVLIELLVADDASIRKLAADEIGMLGPPAIKAIGPLLKMLQTSLEDDHKIDELARAIADEDQRTEFLSKAPEFSAAASSAYVAVWRLSHDSARLLTHIRQSYASPDEPFFAHFNKDDLHVVQSLLDDEDIDLKLIGFEAVLHLKPELVTREMIAKMCESPATDEINMSYYLVRSLKRLRGSLVGEFVPKLIEAVSKEQLRFTDFAEIVCGCRIRNTDVVQFLNEGLHSENRFDRQYALRALAAATEPVEAATRLVIDHARANSELRRTALESIRDPSRPVNLVLPFAIECLDDDDHWTRHRAIMILANLGSEARSSIAQLQGLSVRNPSADSDSEQTVGPHQLEIALALGAITGDTTEFRNAIDQAINDKTEHGWRSRGAICNLLREFGPRADDYFESIKQMFKVDETSRESAGPYVDHYLLLFATISSRRCLDQLRSHTNHRDWIVRDYAKRLLINVETGQDVNDVASDD